MRTTPEVESVLACDDFRDQLKELADKLAQPLEPVLAEAIDCLREMAAVHSQRVTDPWHRFGRWMLRG